MYKEGWKEYISEIKLSLKYIEKELDTLIEDSDICSEWNAHLRGELKTILQKTAELL